jgi:hypothetical protein
MRAQANRQSCRSAFRNLALLSWTAFMLCLLFVTAPSARAQQKPQWQPGQSGLNAGILPSPGFTYVNLDLNYDADSYNDLNGKAVPVTGNYNVWAVENIFYFVPTQNFSVEIWDSWSCFPPPRRDPL